MKISTPILLVLALVASPAVGTAAAPPDALDASAASAWIEDLDAYLAALGTHHPDRFHTTDRADFEAAVARLREAIPTMTRAECIVGLARVTALVGDGHTWMPLYRVPIDGMPAGPGFDVLPLRLASFADGLFVVGAGAAHADLLGRRVTRVGSVGVDEAIARMLTLLPADAPNFAGELVDEWLLAADVLRALEIAGDGPIPITTADGTTAALDAVPVRPDFDWLRAIDTAPAALATWRTAREATPPLFRRHAGASLRVADLGDVHYAQILQIGDTPDVTFADFAADVAARLGAMDTPRAVLDLRLCAGGDGSLNHHLVDALADIDFDDGHFTVLIDGGTHSAAIMMLSDLERRTNARFVGEPAADRPNHYGETNLFVTPNSRLPILHASVFYPTGGEGDTRAFHAPHVPVAPASDDYVHGRDPVLARALEVMDASTARAFTRSVDDTWHHDPPRDRVGRIYAYERGNRDGTNLEHIEVYRASPTALEVFKSRARCAQAALVRGTLDLDAYTTTRLQGGQLLPDAEVHSFADLRWKPTSDRTTIRVEMPQATIEEEAAVHTPLLHIYDFDFASLTVMTPHLRDPRAPFAFGLVTAWPDPSVGDMFFWVGEVVAAYVGDENRDGRAVRKYRLRGTAFDHPMATGDEGTLWLDADQGHVVEALLPLPNHPGYDDFRLRLVEVIDADRDAWTARLRAHHADCAD